MYKGFIIDDFEVEHDRDYIGNNVTPDLRENVYLLNEEFNSDLEKFILQDVVDRDLILDGSKIIQKCFPQVKADIFISHSHKDISEVKDFARRVFLKTGLVSFIDSEVWEYADKLLNRIDKIYTHNAGKHTYDYNLRNVSTSYVHLMLNTALLNMIDSCECLFFLNTPNSFNIEEEIKDTTYSPWIYSELSMANSIEKKIPIRYEGSNKSLREARESLFSQVDSKAGFKIALRPDTDKLIQCNYSQISNWLGKCNHNRGNKNLDILYDMFSTNPYAISGRL